ncbi:unnamed protein product, partial [Arabidopsis halleri]
MYLLQIPFSLLPYAKSYHNQHGISSTHSNRIAQSISKVSLYFFQYFFNKLSE